MNEDLPRATVHRYFAGLAENTFQSELGIVDPTLIDYLSSMLVRFVRSDVVHRIRGISGKPLMSVPEMVAEASARLGDARRELHQHIGDFTLFWAGVYPEALRQTEADDSASEQFLNYCRFGKQSYHIASTIESSTDEAAPGGVLQRLSDQFDLCCYGLREVRRQWESGGGDNGSILLN
jgi:hypothetical protein